MTATLLRYATRSLNLAAHSLALLLIISVAPACGAQQHVPRDSRPSARGDAVKPVVHPPKPRTDTVVALTDFLVDDGRPVSNFEAFRRAIEACRRMRAARLVIPPGRYVFDDERILEAQGVSRSKGTAPSSCSTLRGQGLRSQIASGSPSSISRSTTISRSPPRASQCAKAGPH